MTRAVAWLCTSFSLWLLRAAHWLQADSSDGFQCLGCGAAVDRPVGALGGLDDALCASCISRTPPDQGTNYLMSDPTEPARSALQKFQLQMARALVDELAKLDADAYEAMLEAMPLEASCRLVSLLSAHSEPLP